MGLEDAKTLCDRRKKTKSMMSESRQSQQKSRKEEKINQQAAAGTKLIEAEKAEKGGVSINPY